MCHDAAVGRHSVRATHPGVLIAVLAAAGISVSLTQTLMIPLIPELPALLNTSPANASWTITVTLLTAAVATPVFGRLGDMYGPKPMLMICAGTMAFGSFLAAVSSSLVPFIIGRGLQGMSLPIIPLAISVLRSALPADRVGPAMGLISSSLGVGGALGLPLSAVIAQKADWHILFWSAAVLGIAALLLFAFRSMRPLLVAFVSTALGVVGAITTTIVVFGQLHLLTLVFGAALLGEAVDYSIQYLCARAHAGTGWQPERGVRQVRPALLLALATSLLGYALLALVPFPALRQMAVFAIAGMAVACASVFWLLPAMLRRPARAPLAEPLVRLALGWQRIASGRRAVLAIAVLAVAALPGWWRLGHDDDVHQLISPPPSLDAQAATIRDVAGFGGGSQFWLVEGTDAEEVLQREEALTARLDRAHIAWTGMTAMLPSRKRQAENVALVCGHGPAHADDANCRDRLRSALGAAGLKPAIAQAYADAYPGTPFTLDDWQATPAYTPFRYLWMDHASIVLPQGNDDVATLRDLANGLPGVSLIDKPAGISALFGHYRAYASLWLGGALLLVGLAFAWRYGARAAWRVLLPPAAGIVFSVAALGYLGEPLTLFHVMALMLVLGVGANYAVFLREGEPHAADRPGAAYAGVLLSAVTALLSFGLLALSTMPALQHFGLTLLLGIGFTALLAPVSASGRTTA
jgi:predicted exporter